MRVLRNLFVREERRKGPISCWFRGLVRWKPGNVGVGTFTDLVNAAAETVGFACKRIRE